MMINSINTLNRGNVSNLNYSNNNNKLITKSDVSFNGTSQARTSSPLVLLLAGIVTVLAGCYNPEQYPPTTTVPPTTIPPAKPETPLHKVMSNFAKVFGTDLSSSSIPTAVSYTTADNKYDEYIKITSSTDNSITATDYTKNRTTSKVVTSINTVTVLNDNSFEVVNSLNNSYKAKYVITSKGVEYYTVKITDGSIDATKSFLIKADGTVRDLTDAITLGKYTNIKINNDAVIISELIRSKRTTSDALALGNNSKTIEAKTISKLNRVKSNNAVEVAMKVSQKAVRQIVKNIRIG